MIPPGLNFVIEKYTETEKEYLHSAPISCDLWIQLAPCLQLAEASRSIPGSEVSALPNGSYSDGSISPLLSDSF